MIEKIITIILSCAALLGLMYLLSRIQMWAWIDTIEKHFRNKSDKLKNKQNEQTEQK